ncbi:MAG: DUF1361 domain-containing protein [Flavobacteriaceae bacterium]|nr:DUF1361 domain-containing protein [Flavobacteriaceae bacterium]
MDNKVSFVEKIWSQKINRVLLLSIGFSLAIITFRIKRTETIGYIFLVWNLFLATIPYGITQVLKHTEWARKSTFMIVFAFGFWLLFLPNAPYIITDLMHLKTKNDYIIWFDAFMIFVFAWNGLLMGILSIIDMYEIIKKRWTIKAAIITVFCVAFLSGFGIYLGRFLRWNSWELFSQPIALFQDIMTSCFDPAYRFKTWGVTLGFGSFLYLLFLFFKGLLTSNK